jgi:hypothetical protein
MHFVARTLAAIALTGSLITSATAGLSTTDVATPLPPKRYPQSPHNGCGTAEALCVSELNRSEGDDLKRAAKTELHPDLERYIPRFVQVESGGNPNARIGKYAGLLQMGPAEIRQYGGKNLEHGRAMLADRAAAFQQSYGRQPSATELYLIHQQGEGGLAAHMRNPDAPAWRNMASTAEARGRRDGEAWARRAIWRNVPDGLKKQFGSVDNITSAQFMDLWNRKIERAGDASSPAQGAVSETAL